MYTFRVPSRTITDQSLLPSTRVLLITLYSCCNKHRLVNKSIKSIANLAGLSPRTVMGGLRTLESTGYIHTTNHKRYDRRNNRVLNDTSSYYLMLPTARQYTKLPRRIFDRKHDLTAADFCVIAYLHMLGAKSRRAFPSKYQIAQALGIAKSTVAAAIKKIRNNLISTLLLQHCRRNRGTKGGDYAASSYYVVIALHDDMPRRSAPRAIRASFRYTRCRRQYRKTTNRIHRPYSVFDCQYQIAPNGQIYLCLNTNYRLRSRRRQYKYRL